MGWSLDHEGRSVTGQVQTQTSNSTIISGGAVVFDQQPAQWPEDRAGDRHRRSTQPADRAGDLGAGEVGTDASEATDDTCDSRRLAERPGAAECEPGQFEAVLAPGDGVLAALPEPGAALLHL